MKTPPVLIPKWLLSEKVQKAFKAGAKLEDLFLVIPVRLKENEGDDFLEINEGRLRVFFVQELYEFQKYGKEKPTAMLLHKSKYNYPVVNKVTTRHIIHTLN